MMYIYMKIFILFPNYSTSSAISLGFLYSRVLGTSMGSFGGPTDRVGESFNFFVNPLSNLCVSDTHLGVREKHAS